MEKDCTFCSVIAGTLPADFVFRNESLVVFRDIHPHAPIHLLIVPRKHIRSINELEPSDERIVAEMIMTGRELAAKEGIARSGYKLLFNVERGGGQVIFHAHLHMLAGRALSPKLG